MRHRHLVAATLAVALSASGCAQAPAPAPEPSPPPLPSPPAVDPYAALSAEDVRLAAEALDRALEGNPDGQRLRWRGEASGNHGSITPLRTHVTRNGYFCRTYQESLSAGGAVEQFRHEACRNEMGRWVWL